MLNTDRNRLLIACMINLLAVSAVFMTQSIFLELSQSFAIDITRARFSFSMVSLFYAAAFLFLGPAADTFDLPTLAMAGLLLLSATILFASYTARFDLFIMAMALTGLGAALIPASMFPHIAKTAPPDKTGVYMGAIVASGTLGVIFGRVAMGLMTSLAGWRFSFRIVSCGLLLFSLLTFLSLVEKPATRTEHRQPLSRLYMNGIRLVFDLKILSLLMAGFSLFVGFLGMVTFLTYRLIGPPFNFSSGEVGWISFAGLTALIAPFAGHLSSTIGTYKTIFSALVVCLVAFQLMGWFPSIPLTTLGLLLLFLGVYTLQPLVFLLIGQHAPPESLGSASSLYILCCIGGGSLSSIFLGPVWQAQGWPGITILCSASLLISLTIMAAIAVKEGHVQKEAATLRINP